VFFLCERRRSGRLPGPRSALSEAKQLNTGSRAAVLRRRERRCSSFASDDEVGGFPAAIRAERSEAIEHRIARRTWSQTGARSLTPRSSSRLRTQPPLWLAPTAMTMMVMMIVSAMDTRAMIVKILPSMRPTLMFCSLVYWMPDA
jgi:hypothetical protein